MSFYVHGQQITVATLETALDRLAVIMSEAPNEGLAYLPIWQRVERELMSIRCQNDAMSNVRERQRRLSMLDRKLEKEVRL